MFEGEWIPDPDEDGGEGGCIASGAVLCFSAVIVGVMIAGVSWGWW